MNKSRRTIRSINVNKSRGQLGFGFMEKHGVKIDQKDASFYFYSLVYVIKGTGYYIDSDGIKYKLTPGSIFQRFPGIRHTNIIDPSSQWSECFIDLGEDIFNFLVSMRIINNTKPVFYLPPDNSIKQGIFHNLEKLELCLESELPSLLIKTITLIQRIFNHSLTDYENDIPIDIIEESCSNFTQDLSLRINIREYCLAKGLGYESFRKIFKDYIGISPGKYIVRRRIDMACQILKSTSRSISEISRDLGYKSQYEFSSQFKKQIGVSPYNFRKGKEIIA